MLSDLVALVISVSPVLGLLAWREHVDRQGRTADLVRADVHTGATRALGGESLLATKVEAPRPGAPVTCASRRRAATSR